MSEMKSLEALENLEKLKEGLREKRLSCPREVMDKGKEDIKRILNTIGKRDSSIAYSLKSVATLLDIHEESLRLLQEGQAEGNGGKEHPYARNIEVMALQDIKTMRETLLNISNELVSAYSFLNNLFKQPQQQTVA